MNPTDPTNSQVDGSRVDLAVVTQESQAVERAKLNLDELHENLLFIRQVMAREMKEGQDYGKIPGCGDKPGLFQPGAQKLLMTFKLTPHVKKEVLRELPHPSIFGHREYEFTISVRSNTGREWDGVGTCSTFESKYRYRKSSRKCPTCGKETIFKDKNPPHGFYCWSKKGGCGAKFGPDDKSITGQEEGKADNENPAEFWNTVRKMAFKRAIVHASINATNTSELWSQDLEDLPQAQRSPSVAEDYGISNSQAMEAADDNPCFDTGHTEPPKPSPQSTSTAKARPVATQARRTWVIAALKATKDGNARKPWTDYIEAQGWITPQQLLEDWDLKHVPVNGDGLLDLIKRFDEFCNAKRGEA